MRNMTRLIAAGALSVPMFLGAAGMAMADPDVSYENVTTAANEDGAGYEAVYSGEFGDIAYFVEEQAAAGEWGAYSEGTGAVAGDDFAYFWEHLSYAGEDGAYHEHTDSSVHDGHDGHDGHDE
jgi:hypothetical protein